MADVITTRSGRVLKRPRAVYVPNEVLIDDYSENDYDSDSDGGSDIATDDEMCDSDEEDAQSTGRRADAGR